VAACTAQDPDPSGAGGESGAAESGVTESGAAESKGDDVDPVDPVECDGLAAPQLDIARIELGAGTSLYPVTLEWSIDAADDVSVLAEVASSMDGSTITEVMAPVPAAEAKGSAGIDKLMPDIFVRLSAQRSEACRTDGPWVRLAKPDYADPDAWNDGWIRVVSHTHTIADLKEDRGDPVHANRINWFNGCFDLADDDAVCHALLSSSFAESGVQWLMDAAADNGIDSVIVTDHDNVGIWFTDVFRRYNRADASGPSVVAGMEWTSALGHLTVVGNFLPEVPSDARIEDLETAKLVHTSTPLPPDICDDTDENHDVNAPAFDGPDAPCVRDDHRGHGDEPLSLEDARASIEALHERGALVFANHPTNESGLEPPMAWQLENFDMLDGVEVNTPDPTLTNRDAPEFWRDNGLREGRRWVGIAGTDCHVNGPAYDGSTGCNEFHGLVDLTHMDAPYMWVQPLGSTEHAARNAPDLVVAALREGRVTVVQDVDPAVVADLGIDVNDDGLLDYWSGSVVPACEQPSRDEFVVQVRVRAIQTHNYNVDIWRANEEERLLDREEIGAGDVWVGETSFSRSDIAGARGFVTAWVREDKTLAPDNDAGFSNAILFEAADASATPCDTRDESGR
jgi:hypothetical protein